MKSLTDHLTQYAAYHQDARNVATHVVGIPMIVLGVAILLSRPAFDLSGVPLSAALLLTLGTVLFHLRLDVRFGAVMAVLLAASLWIGQVVAEQSTTVWLSAGLGSFVVGWAIQFVGHWFEGKKPAFVDDIVGLFVGPLFLLAELAFVLGLRKEVQAAIHSRLAAVPSGAGAGAGDQGQAVRL